MFETQDVLKDLLTLPHRGLGTQNELKAAEKIKSYYEKLGLSVNWDNFLTVKRGTFWEMIFPSVAFLICSVMFLLNFNVIGILIWIIGLILYLEIPFRFIDLFKYFFKTYSQNISSEIKPISTITKQLIICAHYDTAPVTPFLTGIMLMIKPMMSRVIKNSKFKIRVPLPFFLKTPFLGINLGNIIAFILIIFKLDIPLIESILVIGSGMLTFFTFQTLSPYNPGALDNGIGVALTIKLAETFSRNNLKNTKIIFLNTGSEEGPVKGISRFLHRFKVDIPTYFLNLESIGDDIPVIVNGECDIKTGLIKNYDNKLYSYVENFITNNEKYNRKVKSIDLPAPTDVYEVLLDKRFKVFMNLSSIQAEGFPTQYHQMSDTYENINWKSVELSESLLVDLIREFDKTNFE